MNFCPRCGYHVQQKGKSNFQCKFCRTEFVTSIYKGSTGEIHDIRSLPLALDLEKKSSSEKLN